jgi:cell division protein FtsB
LLLLLGVAVVLAATLRDAIAKDKDEAKVPRALDATAARQAQLEAQEQTNEKLDELIRLFKSGQARVVVETPKEQ